MYPPIISADKLSYSYISSSSISQALCDLSIDIASGEFIAVLGTNGSGKSTLARHLNGLLKLQSGTLTVADINISSDISAEELWNLRRKCSMVFQNPDNQFIASTVAEDIAFGPENYNFSESYIQSRVQEMIHTFHLEGFEHRLPSSLSGGEKQKVALAGALAINPDIIISDEATSMLDGIERAEFMNNLKMLSTAAGKTVIMITHDINEASLADRIAILNHGKIKAYDTPEKIFNNISLLSENGLSIPPYVRLFHDLKMYGILSGKCPSTETAVVSMIINALASTAMIESKSISDDCATSETTGFINTENSNPAITLKDVSYIYDTSSDPVVKNVSITINSGEITGITGPAGSGKTTLIQIMAGIILPHSGSVITLENDTARTDTIHQIRNKTGFLFQYPEYQLFETTVFKDVAFSLKYSGLTKKEIKERVTNALLTVGLNPEIYSDKSPLSLSGGEKRKVALAGILVKQPQLIILDEPLAGLDAFARTELMILLKNLTRKGITIILVTHNSECLYEFSDRILIMTNGIISSDGKPSEICSKKISEREWFALPPYTKIGFMLSEKKLIPRKAYLSYNSLLKAILHTASCKSLLQQNIEEEKTSDSHK